MYCLVLWTRLGEFMLELDCCVRWSVFSFLIMYGIFIVVFFNLFFLTDPAPAEWLGRRILRRVRRKKNEEEKPEVGNGNKRDLNEVPKKDFFALHPP